MSRKIKNEQKKFLGETLNQYDKTLDEAINQLDKKNREQNHKISSLVNSFDNEFLEKDVEGNMTTLENSKDGMVIINEIQGSTEVNYCKDGEKELILNGDIDTQGESFVTITEGVDGGLVDVALEGNTEINLSKTKDPVLVTREFDDINCNSGKLQYTIDDVTTINDEPGKVDIDRIVGDTMVNHAVNGSEELILNAHINESGDNNITLNGVTSDGGKVDVALEGNTLVNVSKTKDDYITPSIEDKVDKGSVISLPEVSEGYINIDSIEGNTLVNYCTDGAKELTLNGDIDVEGTFVTTTEGVDNGLVGIMCEGNTLVNLWNKNHLRLSGQCSISGNKITCTTTDNQWSNFVMGDSSLFKPSTDYTFIVNITKNTLDINDTIVITSDSGGNNVDIFSKGGLPGFSIKGGVTGLQIKKLTTCSSFEGTTSAVRSFISNDTQVAGQQVELDIVILEGDWTDKEIPQYFEGMKSVGQDDVNGHKVEIVSTNSDESLSNKKEISLNEPLRGLPNGTKDRFVKIGGKWFVERNCGSIGFNEIINAVVLGDSNKEKTLRFKWKTSEIPNMKPKIGYNFYCNNFKYTKYSDDTEGLDIGGDLDCNILRSKLQTQDINGFKQWVENNPTTLIYELSSPTYEPLEIEPTLNTYNEVTHISNNSIIPCNMQIKNTGYNAIIKPSTLYTVAVDTDKNGEIGINLGGAEVTTTNNVATITTPSTLTDDSLRLYGKGIKANRVRLLEGDKTNWIPSFFEGMKSSFEDKVQEDNSYKMEILMSNRNLIDIQNISFKNTTDYTLENNKIIINSSKKYQAVYYYIPVKRGTTYTICCKNITGGTLILLYRGKITGHVVEKYLGSIYDTSLKKRVIADEDYITIRVSNENSINTECIFEDILFYEGVEDVDYVPHKSNKIQLSSIEPLRGIGDVHDRLVFKDGKLMIERNCKQENMSELKFAGDTSDTMKCLILFKSKPKAISNIFSNSRGYESATKGQMYVQERGDGMTYLWIPTDPMSREEFTSFLNEKNATIVYAKAEPTYEEIPYDLQKIILESYNNGTLFIDTNIPPTKVSFNCFEEELTYLYPSTSYTVQFMSDRNTTVDVNLGGTSLLAQSIVKGLNRISITTPSELANSKLLINGAGAKINEVVVTDTDRKFRYFEGMKSVGECEGNVIEILSHNKNILNIKDAFTCVIGNWGMSDLNNYNPTNGTMNIEGNTITVSGNTNYHYLAFPADLKKGVTYYLNYNCNKVLGNTISFFTDLNTPRIEVKDGGCGIFTLKQDCKYIGFPLNDNVDSYTLSDLYININENYGYAEPKSNSQILTHEPLRAVGDAKDRYVLIDGKWYIERKCNEVIMNSLQGVNVSMSDILTTNNVTTSRVYISYGNATTLFPNIITNIQAGISPIDTICDKLPYKTVVPNMTQENQIAIGKTASGISFRLYGSTLEECESWLNNNPLKITYVLTTPQYEPIDYNPLETYADTTHITTNSAIPTSITIKNHGYNMVALKENTQYTLYVNKDTTNALTYRLGDYVEINSLSKFTFTTPSTLTDKTLRIDGKGTKVNDLMLIEGTPINDSIGYFDGLKSSYECEQVTDENDVNYGKYKVDIKIAGKNKINKPSVMRSVTNVDDKYICSDGDTREFIELKIQSWGQVFESSTVKWTKFITTKAITSTGKYSVTFTKTNIDKYLRFANNGKTKEFNIFWDISHLKNGEYTFSFELLNLTLGALEFKDFQLEYGNTATEYEPYFESTQSVYLNSPLLKGDEIVWKDNKIQHYHKMKTVVFDGSNDEGWLTYMANSTYRINTVAFRIDLDNFAHSWDSIGESICDKFYELSHTDFYSGDMEGINSDANNNGQFLLAINKTRLATQDVVGFKQWLQSNPIKVTYKLKTPYYEEISDYPLKLNVIANSSLSTESTIQVTNISFNIYEETLPYLYPDTKYYITFNADVDRNNIIINLGGSHTVLDCKVGFNKVEITTPNDTTNLLTFSGTGVNIDHVKVTQQDIDEYFESMKSVGECEGNVIEIVSQNNLANIATSGTSNFQVANIRAGVTYSMKCTRSDNTVRYNLLLNNINGEMIKSYIIDDFCKFTSPKDGILFFNAYKPGILVSDIMLVEGAYTEDTIPQFKPYTENKQQLTHEPLRGVGDYRDRYVLIDGKWYVERNTYKYKITKDTKFFIQSDSLENYDILAINTSNFPLHPTNKKPLCDKFLTQPANWNNLHHEEIECVQTYDNDRIFIKVLSSRLPKVYDNAMDNFKEWLTNNEFSIIYQVASPVYEPLDYNPFETYSDITHISANSLIPTNVVVKNHGYNCILKPSTTYTIVLNKPNDTISAKLGGSAKVDSTNNIFTITTPSTLNDNILRLSGSGNVKDVMILEGDKTVNTPSYFEGIESVFEQEYDVEKGKYRVTARVEGNGKESSIIFYINEPLRGTGTAKDKVFIQDGKVVVERNCGKVVVNDTKDVFIFSDIKKTVKYRVSKRLDVISTDAFTVPHILSNKLPTKNLNLWSNIDSPCISTDSNGNIVLRTYVADTGVTKDSIKQWLQANPITIVYQLAEPVYEEADCDLSKLVLENYENSSLIFESNIPVSANIRYSGEVPVVTQAKTLSSKVDNTTFDINENIIPYMCDIDYRIVELQLMNGDTQGEGIELLGIGDIEILGNENVLFNNREDKKHNYSYDMLKRDILSQRYSKEEYQYRLDRYLLANKISDEEYKELEGLLNNGE